MKVLAGDIGGTHARLALCDVDGRLVRREIETTYESRNFQSLAEIARTFVAEHDITVQTACFGIPGPVSGRRAQTTNLPWEIDADDLERGLGLRQVHLLNDLEATAHSLVTLSDADFRTLRVGERGVQGNAGLVAAGTGLGQAGLYWDGRRHRPFACEGGHTSFAPGDDREVALQAWLRTELGGEHVSWERVVSGPGLFNLYRFLRLTSGAPEPAALTHELATVDPPQVITRHGVQNTDPTCRAACEWLMALWGAEAGNVALKYLARGGIVLAGGFAARLADALPKSAFVERFDAKGRMRPLLERIPITILMNDKAALQGAAYHAHMRARGDHG